MKHQDRAGGTLFIEKHAGSYRPITNKNSKTINLHDGAWRALNGCEQACIATIRNSHKAMGQGSAAKGKGDRGGERKHASSQGEYY